MHHIEKILDAARIAPEVRVRALEAFRRLAVAEAEVHGSTPEKVHFHEVGAADALVDIVGTFEGLAALGIERCWSSVLRLGRGEVNSQHGLIPVPAPATTLLLRGVPVEITTVNFELVTPTGAALAVTAVADWGAPPPFRLERIGTGAGGRDLRERPNVLRMLVGEAEVARPGRRRVAVLETAVDDDQPQYVAALIPRLIEAGALDAMMVPTVMKKGRTGSWLVVGADPERAEGLAEVMMREATTLGVRVREEERFELERRAAEVVTAFGPVALKVADLPGGGTRAVPEFESLRAVAERTGRPLREIAEAALDAWRETTAGA